MFKKTRGCLIGLHKVESILVFFAFFQTVLLSAGIAFAQSVNGLISGTIVDQQHGSVPGATVQITDELKTTSQTTQTDENGYFTFSGVRPGKYTLSVEKKGFEKLEERDILLLTADRLSVGTLSLKIGPGTDVVTVTSENPPVETTSSEQSSVISAEEMVALPVPTWSSPNRTRGRIKVHPCRRLDTIVPLALWETVQVQNACLLKVGARLNAALLGKFLAMVTPQKRTLSRLVHSVCGKLYDFQAQDEGFGSTSLLN